MKLLKLAGKSIAITVWGFLMSLMFVLLYNGAHQDRWGSPWEWLIPLLFVLIWTFVALLQFEESSI